MYVRVLALFFCFFLCTPIVPASELDSPSVAGDLALGVDTYSFVDEVGLYEEVAIRFPAKHLTFMPQGDTLLVARYVPHLHVFDLSDKLVKKIEGERVFTLPVGANIEREFVNDIARFQLPSGQYRAILTVETEDHVRVGRTTFTMVVPVLETGKLFLSDLFFYTDGYRQDGQVKTSPFEKAGHILLPNPRRTFEGDGPLQFYFFLSEIGQLAHTVRFQILDDFDHTVFDEVRNYPTYREDARFLEGISLRHLLPGTYKLRIEVQAADQMAVSERRFLLRRAPTFSSDTFTSQRQAWLLKTFKEYIEPKIMAQYQALSVGDRAKFVYDYWLARQPFFARAYVGPVTGMRAYDMPLGMLRALGHEGTLKQRVDRTFAERLPKPDTLQIQEARAMLKGRVKDGDAFAAVANAVLALEAGLLAEGDDYAQLACEKWPDLPSAFFVLGMAKVGRKDWRGALQNFEKAAVLDPNWKAPAQQIALVHFLSGKKDDEEILVGLAEVVAQDPSHPWFHYFVGRVHERKGQLVKSGDAYAQQIAVHPLHSRARFDRGRVLFKTGHIDSATVVWRDLMEKRPDYRNICIYPLLDAYLNTGETGKAQAVIAEELRTLSDEARARLEDIALLASPEELATYKALPAEERPRYVRAFWQKRDPTPATPGNERLVEHYRRVLYALRTFSRDGKTWDRRGNVYIRYGEPAHVSKRGDIRFETVQDVVRVKERLLNTLSPEAKQEILARAGRLRTSTRDVEIESQGAEAVTVHDFESIDFEMNPNRVYFASGSDDVNTYVRGKELFGRDQVGMSERTIRGLPLYPVNGSEPWEYWIYPGVAGGIEVVFTALTPRGDFDFPDVSQGRKLARFNQRLWEDHRPEVVVKRATRVQSDRYTPPGHVLDFHYASADFRGRESRTRLEVYLGVPILDVVANEQTENTFERGIALFDSLWTPIYRQVTAIAFEADALGVEEGTLAIDELALQVPPGRYYLGLQVHHPASNRQGGYTQEIVIEDYGAPNLQVSDIELAGQVKADSTTQNKGGLQVVPLPSGSYKKGQPIVIYYEVYGLLLNAFGQTSYRVDYRITPRKGKLSGVQVLHALGRLLGIEEKSVVTISYEHTGKESDEYNYIQIDPGESKPGRYEIAVTVTDQNAEKVVEKNVMLFIDN